jgi:hypothetical protein
VHLVGFYLLLLSSMHGTMNLKFTNGCCICWMFYLNGASLCPSSTGSCDCSLKELLMMGTMVPETCWAASVWLSNKCYDCLLHLLDVSFEYMKMHGTTNSKKRRRDTLHSFESFASNFAELQWKFKTNFPCVLLIKSPQRRIKEWEYVSLIVQLGTRYIQVVKYIQMLFYHRENWRIYLFTVDGCATDLSLFNNKYKIFFLPWFEQNLKETFHMLVKHGLKVL